MNILVTGAAGFIGFHTSSLLLNSRHNIYGLDSLNNYYSVALKKKRVQLLKKNGRDQFNFIKNNLSNEKFILDLIKKKKNYSNNTFSSPSGSKTLFRKTHGLCDK